MTTLDKICEILCEIELADDTALRLHGLMSGYETTASFRFLKRHSGFFKLWDAIAEAVDRAGGFEGR